MHPPAQNENSQDQTRLLAVSAEVGRALTTYGTLGKMLHLCCEALVTHLDAAFARIWVLDDAENVLILQASAGQYTHLDGPHGRVPVGQFKIGRIAQERKPHLTNAVIGDPRVSDQAWAKREGMVAFAGYPLIVAERLVGVAALFARQPLSDVTLLALGSVADQIAVGIDRVRTEVAMRISEAHLREAQAHLEEALAAGGIAAWTWDVARDRVVADANLARLFSISPEETGGEKLEVYLQAIHPDDRDRVSEAIKESVAHRDDYEVEYRVMLPDSSYRWLEARGKVERDGANKTIALPGIVMDITERVEREQREGFLAELSDRARQLTASEEVIADAVNSLGAFLGLSRCAFADIDIEADTCSVPVDYCADASITSMTGVFPISAFGDFLVSEFKLGRAVVVDDVYADPVRVPPESLSTYQAASILAHVVVPVVHSARTVSIIACHSAVPRHWHPEEVELLRTVVERTWLTVEVVRQRHALLQAADEKRVRAEREALLNRIALELRSSTHPERVLEIAVQALGKALGADRCYYAAYDMGADIARVGPDWHLEHLPTIAGQYPMSRFAVNQDSRYRAGHTQIVRDTREDLASIALGLRALVRVPLVSGASMTALSAAMVGGPREWTADDVSLVEAVATQTQTALEAALVRRKEHVIAQQLQAALQPSIPTHIPGLSVGSFTRPALDEAQLGGDFYDLFPISPGHYALVIGDVSGKGLAAAAQLALVRNSLRMMLYLHRSPALAVSTLNVILTAHDLLVGFVTAFVSLYDSSTGVITYASCGHEPGLVRRVGGTVEELAATGPPLGLAEEASYDESSVTLWTGDTLLLYTDGLSEAGSNRLNLLGTAGLTTLFMSLPEDDDMQSEAASLVTRVGDFAGGIFRDDIAVLLARRQ